MNIKYKIKKRLIFPFAKYNVKKNQYYFLYQVKVLQKRFHIKKLKGHTKVSSD